MNQKISGGSYELVETQNEQDGIKFLVRFRVAKRPEIISQEKNARWVTLNGVYQSEASARIAAGDWVSHMNRNTFSTYKLLECRCEYGGVAKFRVRMTVPSRKEVI